MKNFRKQKTDASIKGSGVAPLTEQAYELIHEGVLVFSEMERTGIHIDVDYCKKQHLYLERKINYLERKLLSFPEVKEWKKITGEKFNIDSNPQLGHLLYDISKIKPKKLTTKGKPSVDIETLSILDMPFTDMILQRRKLKKAKDTYLGGILREQVDGVMHPFFNLHTVTTYRSSSDKINFQNIPIRDPDIGQIVRRAFIPSPGHRFGGVDYNGIEVRIAACYHKDPTMMKYIEDPTTDMHRDTAMDCYLLKRKGDVTKETRYAAKNMFVFPQLYGDYYKNCAPRLWSAISKLNLKTAKEGLSIKEHLRNKKITSYKKFESHIQKVEHNFWGKKFSVYAEWKDTWFEQYEKQGYFTTLTGFTCSGVMKKNDVINYPIQGSAFHCLLWSLIQLHKWLKKNKLKSHIIAQIHDEIIFDMHPQEIDYVLEKVHQIMCIDIRKAWDWIIVPLEIEAEFAEVDESWYYEKKYPITWKEDF